MKKRIIEIEEELKSDKTITGTEYNPKSLDPDPQINLIRSSCRPSDPNIKSITVYKNGKKLAKYNY
jgi:hypothetical protein